MNVQFHKRVVLNSFVFLEETNFFVVRLAEMDPGGNVDGIITMFSPTPERFIELGHDLIEAGLALRQHVAEFPAKLMEVGNDVTE
jgi:hypothetical protein